MGIIESVIEFFNPITHSGPGCLQNQIQEIAENSDHEYYMAALNTVINPKDQHDIGRAERALKRIQDEIENLSAMKQRTPCAACRKFIDKQLKLQREGAVEISQGIAANKKYP